MVLTVTIYGACRLTDRPDLAPARDRGQRAEGRGRAELWVSTFMVMTSQTLKFYCFRVYHKINGNDLSICQNL